MIQEESISFPTYKSVGFFSLFYISLFSHSMFTLFARRLHSRFTWNKKNKRKRGRKNLEISSMQTSKKTEGKQPSKCNLFLSVESRRHQQQQQGKEWEEKRSNENSRDGNTSLAPGFFAFLVSLSLHPHFHPLFHPLFHPCIPFVSQRNSTRNQCLCLQFSSSVAVVITVFVPHCSSLFLIYTFFFPKRV